MAMEQDGDSYGVAKAPTGGPPNDWFFSNERGTWAIKKNVTTGVAGAGLYIWFDGTPNNDQLEFVSAGVLSRPGGDHLGWTYKVQGANFWWFFSYTPLYFDGFHTYYPLYYSFKSDDSEFKRFLTASWTFGVKGP